MKASVIIPVWNGKTVIGECLKSLLEQVEKRKHCEVICVDNASSDESASLISASFPEVRLLRQPVNLGFAGGVNAGIEVAGGDVFLILNQDCIVQPGWLDALLMAVESSPRTIFGCLILNRDGSIDHIGARIQRPEAVGVHITESADAQNVEYMSGAALAFHRRVWDTVGRFDEGFYPAYYEDADYCFRARRHGIEALCVPQAQVVHLRSSEEWRTNPLRYRANYHTVRYRFACKHFSEGDLKAFFEAEKEKIKSGVLEDIIGRAIAARRNLFLLHDIVQRRRMDLGEVSPVLVRQMRVGLGEILQQALAQPVELGSLAQLLQDLFLSFQSLHSLQLSFLIGLVLPPELAALHTVRMDQIVQTMDQIAQIMGQIAQVTDQMIQRLRLLETLINYEV